MAMLQPASSCKAGDIIKFRVINPHDLNVYQGTVLAVCSYPVARQYGDVVAIHQTMLQANAELTEVTQQKFLIVELNDTTRRPFAFEWIDMGVEYLDQESNYCLFLYNVTAEQAAMVLNLVKEQDISCKISKLS